MKVAVICSNGKVGKLVVKEALSAGFEVTGFLPAGRTKAR